MSNRTYGYVDEHGVFIANNGNNNSNKKGNSEVKHRTVCEAGIGKNKKNYVRGWSPYGNGQGAVSIFCSPYKDSKEHKGATLTWVNWIAKIQVGKGEPYINPCLWCKQTGKVIIEHLGWVLNPKTNYCGRFTKKKK